MLIQRWDDHFNRDVFNKGAAALGELWNNEVRGSATPYAGAPCGAKCNPYRPWGRSLGMPCMQCAHSAKFWMSANTRTLLLAPFDKFLVPHLGCFSFLCIWEVAPLNCHPLLPIFNHFYPFSIPHLELCAHTVQELGPYPHRYHVALHSDVLRC